MYWSAHSMMMMMMVVMMMGKDIFIISNTLNWPSKTPEILLTINFILCFVKNLFTK